MDVSKQSPEGNSAFSISFVQCKAATGTATQPTASARRTNAILRAARGSDLPYATTAQIANARASVAANLKGAISSRVECIGVGLAHNQQKKTHCAFAADTCRMQAGS
jgi:hypothetical protein